MRGAIPILLLKKPKKVSSDMGQIWNAVGHSGAECFDSFFFTSCVEDPRSVRGLQRALGDGAHKLKGFASAIRDNHGSVGLTDLLGIIKTMEGALKGTDVVSKNSFITAAGADPDSRSVYNTAFLIHCVSLASNLRKDKDLLTDAKKALKLVVPPHILAAIEEHATMSCPDKATISRFRMSLDVGWMLTMRNFNSVNSDMDLLELPARWMSLDKSEQAGVNWLIVIYRQVAPYDLEPVAENIDKLCEFYNAAVDAVMAEAEETGDDPDIASIVVNSEIKEMDATPWEHFTRFDGISHQE